jgi:5-formyltetrahydrofolate cyclo-ligase
VSASVFVQPLATNSKEVWRRWAKQLRSHLASPTLDYEIVKALRGSERYQEARHILSYLAFGSEIALTALHQDVGKTFYVTRTWEDGGLTVHPLSKDLESHRYGFLQPPTNAPVVDLHIIDLVLVPGLCFDKRGTRLGYGKGHYDRLLPRLHQSSERLVPRVGVTASQLVVEKLPGEPFDVAMTHLVEETGMWQVKQV